MYPRQTTRYRAELCANFASVKRTGRLLRAAITALCVASTAQAQQTIDAGERAGGIEEIIVTAELRDTPWLEQAASSSIVDASVILRRSATHLEELLLLTPNINLAGGSSRARYYQIRGVGERSQFVEPLNPSVGLLIDGIDFSGLGGAATLFDIDQVEVLRGPQGTLHGANALAGLINVRSGEPSNELGATVRATTGDYGRRDLGASVTGALVDDTLLLRFAAFQHLSNGFINNEFLGRDDTNERDEQLLRGKLRWLVDERQQLDISITSIDIDNGYDAFSLDNIRTTLSDMPGRDRQQTEALGIHYQVAGDAVLTEFRASAAQSDTEYSYDEDWSFVGIAPGLEYSSFDQYLRDRRSYSAQLRASSARPLALALGELDWVAGLYALQDDEALRRRYTFLNEEFRSRFEAETVAAFGQLDLALNETWSISAGLRLANRSMRYADSLGITGQPENSLWGGKIAVKYETGVLGMLYGSVSRGYRAGGVNASILALPEDQSDAVAGLASLRFFDEEVLYNVELGHKQQFMEGNIVSALTLFYMDRGDQQVRGSRVIPRGDGSSAFVDFTDNAASGSNLGLEWELRATLSDKLSGYLNLGLLRTRFGNYVNADGRDLSGREQAHSPSYQFATGLSYRFTPQLTADIEWEGRNAFFFSDRHDERSSNFSLVHLRLAYQRQNWEVALWTRNLLDDDYFIRGFGSFGNDPRKNYVTEEYVQFGEPRTAGLSLEWRL
ncbi:MAG: TonB-dependent receptor [Congregibacter sp.]